jgi:hypothetical protein
MSAARYALRSTGPLLIERGRAATLRLAVYRDQVATPASAGTFSLVDAGGNAIVSGATSSDGTDTTYALGAGDTTTAMGYSARWRATWSLTIGGEAKVFTQDVWLVRSALYPTVTVDDLCRRHRDLRDIVDGGDTAIEGYILEAWASIEGDLTKKGKRLNLIMEAWALGQLLRFRSLAALFRDASTRFTGTDRYADLSTFYEDKAEEEWTKGIRFEYDADEDGIADTKSAGANVLILSAGPMTGPGLRRAYGYR